MEPMKLTGKTFILLICCAATVLLSIALLGDDSAVYMKWCLMSLLFGAGFYPLSSKIFSTFKDRGWIFSHGAFFVFYHDLDHGDGLSDLYLPALGDEMICILAGS